jgi:hypothetical protein
MSFVQVIIVLSFAGMRVMDRVIVAGGAGVPALLAIISWIGAFQGFEGKGPARAKGKADVKNSKSEIRR